MKYPRKKPQPAFPEKFPNPKKRGRKKRFALIWKFLGGGFWEQKYATRQAAETAMREWKHKAKHNTAWFPPASAQVSLHNITE
jgi:hypothetical protein